MIFIYLLNIIIYFSIQLLKLKYTSSFFKKEERLFNPFEIIFYTQLPIEILKIIVGPLVILQDGYENKYYNIAIILTSLANLFDFLLMKFTFKISKKYNFSTTFFDIKINKNQLIKCALFFYFLFLICLLILAASSFGILNWIKHPREGYQFHRQGAGFFWVISIIVLEIAVFSYYFFLQ